MLKLHCVGKQLLKLSARNRLSDWLPPLQTPLKRPLWRALLVKKRRVRTDQQRAAEAEVQATVNGVVVNEANGASEGNAVTVGAAVTVVAASNP
jgi:uncharacterized protein YcfJ